MRDNNQMILQNWWYTTLLGTAQKFCDPLMDHIQCDALVIGAGMTGMHAALRLVESGKQVVLVERNICGGSSTGKSAGFLTPDSELELHQLVRRYGLEDGKIVWSMASDGVKMLVENIQKYHLDCDLLEQDSLFLGLGRGGKGAVHEEAELREKMGYESTVYEGNALKAIHPGKGYSAGIRYGGTYGINPLQYCQHLKKVLIEKGVKVYEGTPVTEITGHTAHTHMGSVEAKNIIVCVDKMRQCLSELAETSYHAQTFLSISEPLNRKEILEIFPDKSFMCWDSKLVYTYYRLTGDNRLLLGGGSALTTFLPGDVTSPGVINKVIKEFKGRFPFLKEHEFIQYWPGRIDTTKDLIPILDNDPYQPHIQYAIGCVGLPWATFCGDYAARRVLDPSHNTHQKFLSKDRKFLIPMLFQRLFGKMMAFSLNNAYSKYVQKDI